MAVAVDSSVLLDLLLPDAPHKEAPVAALETSSAGEGLIICEVVTAEIVPVLAGYSLEDLLSDWEIRFIPCSFACSRLAGQMFQRFLDRGGKRGRVVPDFLVAAHAQVHAGSLLTRDSGYARDYFRSLKIINP